MQFRLPQSSTLPMRVRQVALGPMTLSNWKGSRGEGCLFQFGVIANSYLWNMTVVKVKRRCLSGYQVSLVLLQGSHEGFLQSTSCISMSAAVR